MQPAAAGAAFEEMGAQAALAQLDENSQARDLDLQTPTFPGPVSEAYYWSNADVIGICGPVGSGKTTTKNKRKLRRAMEMPRSVVDGVRRYKCLFTRHTYRELWSTSIPSYLEVFPRALGEWSGGRGDPVTHKIMFEDQHGPIEFVAEFMAFGDDPIAAMRGIQTTDLDLNEADTMKVEILTTGIGRIDRWPARHHFEGYSPDLRSWGCVDCDFNAPDEDNWTHNVFYDDQGRAEMAALLSAELPEGSKALKLEFYNQPGYGEPGAENLHNLAPTYYPRQIAAMKLAGRGDFIDRLVYNKVTWLRAGEPVFQREFNPRIHVSEAEIEVERTVPLRIGLDQGFKGAAVICQFIEPFHWRVLADLFFPRERLMARTFGARLRDLLDSPRFAGCRVEGAYGDMAGEQGQSAADDENANWNRIVSEAAGITIRPQRIGANRIQPRLEAIRAPLEFMEAGQPGLLIDGQNCTFLPRAFASRYVWTEEINRTGDKRKVPDKSIPEANPMDAMQYVALSESLADGRAKIPGAERPNRGPRQTAPTLTAGHDILDPYRGVA